MSGGTLSRQRGVSLIEALVALAVMAFGLLGVVGVQTSLRANADVSKQRSEAVRIAQEAMEQWRGFTLLTQDGGSQVAYSDIASTAGVAVTGYDDSNTTYTLTQTEAATPAGRAKLLLVDVSWVDRGGQTQSVRLTSNIAGVTPELAGALGLPGDKAVTRLPANRNPGIPPGATPVGDGTSSFTPPGAPAGTTWIFNDSTGIITTLCNPVCTAVNQLLLAGYVRFATGGAPTAADAEFPPSAAFDVDVVVTVTNPTGVAPITCFRQTFPTYVSYYCAVPTTTTLPAFWSGSSQLSFPGLSVALSDASATHYKVCRYTPANSDTTPTNAEHPLNYANVKLPLANQNFLVISAGDGSTPYTCPDDGPGPLNTNTYRHQPIS